MMQRRHIFQVGEIEETHVVASEDESGQPEIVVEGAIWDAPNQVVTQINLVDVRERREGRGGQVAKLIESQVELLQSI